MLTGSLQLQLNNSIFAIFQLETKPIIDIFSHFVRELIETLHGELNKYVSDFYFQNDLLLIHTIDELLSGDVVLFGEFGYISSTDYSQWPTFVSFLFQQEELFHRWMDLDLQFARSKLNHLFEANGVLLINDDEINEITIGNISKQILALLESLGTRYQTICGSLKHRKKLVINTTYGIVEDCFVFIKQRKNYFIQICLTNVKVLVSQSNL